MIRLVETLKQVDPYPTPPEAEIMKTIAAIRRDRRLMKTAKKMLVVRYEATGLETLIPRKHKFNLAGLTVLDDIDIVLRVIACVWVDGHATVLEPLGPKVH